MLASRFCALGDPTRLISMKSSTRQLRQQPQPRIPGLSRYMVKVHAERLFRDVLLRRALTDLEWRLAEQDLARKLESDGL